MQSLPKKPYVIVLGNEKGGTGKSTTAMHIMSALLRLDYKVGSIDVDARQGTLSRYVENRKAYIERTGITLPQSHHQAIHKSSLSDVDAASSEDKQNIDQALQSLQDMNFIIIDTGGNDTPLSRHAHSHADTLITPINDSFVDLDVLAHIDSETLDVKKLSIYAENVWEQKKQRAMRDRSSSDWIILRNRLSNIRAHNKIKMEQVLGKLSKRLGFRLTEGFGERVIFRELFISGLTLLDLKDTGQNLTLSHLAAKQELRKLMETMNLPDLHQKLVSGF